MTRKDIDAMIEALRSELHRLRQDHDLMVRYESQLEKLAELLAPVVAGDVELDHGRAPESLTAVERLVSELLAFRAEAKQKAEAGR